MTVADIIFKVIFTVVYSILIVAGVYFIVVYVKKDRHRKKKLNENLINSDKESYGAEEVLTAPSYVKKTSLNIFNFFNRTFIFIHFHIDKRDVVVRVSHILRHRVFPSYHLRQFLWNEQLYEPVLERWELSPHL